MVSKIFARNFRGFREVEISLDEDLFLVGDNSSGKSSILHLINLVSSGDLIGLPIMESENYVGRDDFFSPYFGYADVSLGFVFDDGHTRISRIVTISRVKKNSSYYVKSCTFASEDGAITLKLTKNFQLLGRFIKGDDLLDLASLERLHHQATGFTRLDIDAEAYINETHILFRALLELLPTGTNEPEFARIIFSKPMSAAQLIGPMRGRPEGFYAFDRRIKSSGGHFATLLSDVSDTQPNEIDEAVRSFGKESGLFDDLVVTKASKNISNSPLHVFVKKNGNTFLLNQVGMGVSQIAPIIADTLAASKGIISRQRFLIQQPELHLHPKAQAAFGEYLYAVAKSGTRFCIETHSDFLIDRYRANIRDKKAAMPAAIIYCTNNDAGNDFSRIEIKEDGTLLDPPDDYLDFFINELARTMI